VPLVHVSGHVLQADATRFLPNTNKPTMIFTDPPYYDNISFADLTDFFYVWLRRCLGSIYPDLFSTVLTPKDTELIASPYHFSGDREKADKYFEEGMVRVFVLMKEHADPNYPLVLYYAFKQEEDTKEEVNGTLTSSSTGWEKMLIGLDRAGYQITGTWPIRSTKSVRSVARNANALASAIIIVCRPRPEHAPVATRREFLTAIRKELPRELSALMSGRVAPVDLAQASIGPGMAVFSRYSKVLEADGCAMTVRTALQLINQELDTYLTSQEGELDSDTRFCVSWFEQRGMDEGPYGDAETLAKAKGIAVQGLGDAGIAIAKAGKVRLLKRAELEHNWDPLKESRLTVWGCTQHLIRTLESEGEEAAGHLVTRLGGGRSEEARSLAYRLFAICDKKSWAGEAMAYNALVRAWPEIMRLAQNFKLPEQGQLDIRG